LILSETKYTFVSSTLNKSYLTRTFINLVRGLASLGFYRVLAHPIDSFTPFSFLTKFIALYNPIQFGVFHTVLGGLILSLMRRYNYLIYSLL